MKILLLFSFVFLIFLETSFADNAFIVKNQHSKILSIGDETLKKYQTGEIKFLTPKDFSIYCNKNGCFSSTKKYGKFSSFFILKNGDIKKNFSIQFEIAYPEYFYIGNKIQKNYQQRALSCEISATADIMNYFSRNITETKLVGEISKSMAEELPYVENGYKIWGDPNVGFVGYIHTLPNGERATQYDYTGYGVLEKPIDDLYKKYGFETRIITKKSYGQDLNQQKHLQLLLENLVDGNMIQLWGDYFCDFDIINKTQTKTCGASKSKNRKLEWYYKDKYGNLFKHEGLAGEHAFYILGYTGKTSNPTSIIVWDTTFGELEIPIGEWLRKWNLMGNRSIIIKK